MITRKTAEMIWEAYTDLPRNQIINGDCLEVLKTFPAECADIVWTDPPYGNNNNNGDLIARREAALGKGDYVAGETDRPILNDSYADFSRVVPAMLDEAARILKRDSCCCCCCCGGGGGPTQCFADVAKWIDERLSFFHAVVWDKGGLGMGWRYRRNYEFVMVAHRRGGKLKWEHDSHGAETANVVRINKIIPRAHEHPTPKPVELVTHFLRLHGKRGDLVVDPFCGAGTTCVAAKRLGMDYIGIELDPHWADVARRRLAAEEGEIFSKSGDSLGTQTMLFDRGKI
jgi:DNA modification methylase